MMIIKSTDNSSQQKGSSFYRRLSLIELITRIVEKDDRRALEEFHNHRTVFYVKDEQQPLRFIEYLEILRDRATKRGRPSQNSFEIAEKAFDITVDKFNNLPGDTKLYESKGKKSDRLVKQKGPNCRFYFKAFLNHLNTSPMANPPTGELEKEVRAVKAMQGLVKRHFCLSLLEAKRRINPLWSRYYWNVNGRKICVWLPVGLKGSNRKRWLENNISEPDPVRPGERQRIQVIINRKMPRKSVVSFDDTIDFKSKKNTDQLTDWENNVGESLAKVVAEEKAANIHKQRRSIRKLGKTKLKKMILQIFGDISCDDYRDSEIAKDFGLTKGTFSRFAGSRWNQTGSSIPDLWRNTAHVLIDHPIFKQVVKDTGFWDIVAATVEKSPFQDKKAKSHD
jgi:hypothetical protein